MKIAIGIDPGQDGAYAIINEVSGKVETYPWDNMGFVEAMRAIKTEIPVKVTFLEKVGATPQMGVTSSFSFGKSAGFIEGVLCALGIPYQLLSPVAWKKEYGLIVKGAKLGDKSEKGKMSIAVCKKLFPDVSLLRTGKCRVESDGMAEALLMAEYARRKL